MKLKVYYKKGFRLCMEKYDDIVFCRGGTSRARSVYAPKNLVIIFSYIKPTTSNNC
jgi:hypothetical protein